MAFQSLAWTSEQQWLCGAQVGLRVASGTKPDAHCYRRLFAYPPGKDIFHTGGFHLSFETEAKHAITKANTVERLSSPESGGWPATCIKLMFQKFWMYLLLKKGNMAAYLIAFGLSLFEGQQHVLAVRLPSKQRGALIFQSACHISRVWSS